MKAKSIIFALSLSLLMLGGCVASVGPGYDTGYYQPVRPYYGRPYGARPYYYNPRPAVIVPVRPYRGGYHGDGGYRGGSRGGYSGGGGHSRSRGN